MVGFFGVSQGLTDKTPYYFDRLTENNRKFTTPNYFISPTCAVLGCRLYFSTSSAPSIMRSSSGFPKHTKLNNNKYFHKKHNYIYITLFAKNTAAVFLLVVKMAAPPI